MYQDNNRAFKAKYFVNTDFKETGFEGIYARLGIKTVFARPYNARAKVIERFSKSFKKVLKSFCRLIRVQVLKTNPRILSATRNFISSISSQIITQRLMKSKCLLINGLSLRTLNLARMIRITRLQKFLKTEQKSKLTRFGLMI